MSEQQQPSRTQAAVRRGWKPGWIWAIPVAALIIVTWLGLRALFQGGQDITIAFDNAHGMKAKNTSIIYRGMPVGKVTGVALAHDGRSVVISANIEDRAVRYLRSGTRFWLRGASPSLSDLSTLGDLLSGPQIVMDPGPGGKSRHFVGLSQQPAVPVIHGKAVLYEVSFTGAVGNLKAGTPVKLDGFAVGQIKSIAFRYDAASGAISTPVVLALYPLLFHIRHASRPAGEASLTAAISRLIQNGLRARLDRSPPLIGTYAVSLEMDPGAPTAAPAVFEGLPQIPVAPGGGLDSIVKQVNTVPIAQIAQNVLDITKHIDTIVSSPKLADSVAQLDASLRQIRRTVTVAGPQITNLVKTLRRTAGQLDKTARQVNASIGGTVSQNGLPQTLAEIVRAARSLRELADYLDQHPEALIKGRD